VDLVLTDVEMPGMNGLELAREIRARDPRLPIVYMSGFVGDHEGEAVTPNDTLMKPFDFAVLIERVRAALERGTE
jgi:CheY-like chemotaxis protein